MALVGEFSILLGSIGGATLGSSPWIYTAFATTGVILAAIYLPENVPRYVYGAIGQSEEQEFAGLEW